MKRNRGPPAVAIRPWAIDVDDEKYAAFRPLIRREGGEIGNFGL
jgi:hypothetical protein